MSHALGRLSQDPIDRRVRGVDPSTEVRSITTGPQGASLIVPHGGQLTELIADDGHRRDLADEAQALPSWDLTQRQVCDIELLLNGGFSPLDGFMTRADYERVCAEMRLADGTLWPIPIALDVTEQFGEGLVAGARIALRHPEGMVLAVMTVSDVWVPDRRAEAVAVFGTDDDFHPGVFSLLEQTNPTYVGGSITQDVGDHTTVGTCKVKSADADCGLLLATHERHQPLCICL